VLMQSTGGADAVAALRPMLDAGEVLALQERVDGVHADASIVDYLMAVIRATRAEPRLRAGASTRAAHLAAARGARLRTGGWRVSSWCPTTCGAWWYRSWPTASCRPAPRAPPATEGRPQYMAIITSPANHRRLERYRRSRAGWRWRRASDRGRGARAGGRGAGGGVDRRRAARHRGARRAAAHGDGLAARQPHDAETLRILTTSSLACTPTRTAWSWSPTGTCASGPAASAPRPTSRGCTRSTPATTTTATSTWRAGRDAQHEPRAVHEWFPQIMYNHHQTGPTGTVMFAPPFRDPFNYVTIR
jgi:hypothetical protein